MEKEIQNYWLLQNQRINFSPKVKNKEIYRKNVPTLALNFLMFKSETHSHELDFAITKNI